MKKPIVTILQYVFFLGLGILFVWLSVREINEEQWLLIKASLQRAKLWLIIPVCITLLLSHFSRAIRWKILMEPLGYKPSTFNTFAAVMIGYLVNAGVPRLGEVVKCTILSRYEKVRADKLVGTIVMERAVDMVCLGIVFLLALFFEGHVVGDFVRSLFGNFFQDNAGEVSVTKIILVLGAGLLLLLLFYFLLKRFAHINAVAKINDIIKGIWHGLQSIRYIRHKGWFFFHSVLIWGLYLMSTTLGIIALQETAHLGLGGGLTALAVGSVGMIITPGGIGAYPLLVSKLIGLYGIDETTIGNALGWLLWSVQTVIVIFGGLAMIALFSYYNKNSKPSEARAQLTDEDIAAI
ncbi:MAG TPA: lysylphosphatidylglycerol synthase transmembrane domain-containing protein [Flavisolibacter sp.]|nr:lysylphosphatidylglycerol synthase transmembrane domain-containing protein [Flavisolibacter sp.]